MTARIQPSWIMILLPLIALVFGGCGSSGGINMTAETQEATDSAEQSTADTAFSARAGAKAAKVNIPNSGDVLVIGGANASKASTGKADIFDSTKKKFLATGKLPKGRLGFGDPIISPDGSPETVLISGGLSGKARRSGSQLRITFSLFADGQLYSLGTGSFSKAAGDMANPRAFHTATRLNDGSVLVAGGLDAQKNPITSAEIYDPGTGLYTATGSLNSARAFHTATLLADGKVLVVGGINSSSFITLDTAEIYDPIAKTFALVAGKLTTPVAGHTTTRLSDNRVLITGGFSGYFLTVLSTEKSAIIYDPATQEFVQTSTNLTEERAFHTATLLDNGKVLISGGLRGQAGIFQGILNGIVGGIRNTAELFDPTTGNFSCINGTTATASCAASMTNSRAGHAATRIATGPLAGQVLLTGGAGAPKATTRGRGAPLASSELYNPAGGVDGSFSKTGKMKSARVFHSAISMP
jgi:hypothetical protein